MTQPATAEQPPAQSNTAQIVAVTALGLALIAVEQQVRQQVEDTIAALYKGLAAAAILTASTAPATIITGLALISLPAFFNSTTAMFTSARLKIRDTIATGYSAASQVAYTKTRDELGTTNIPETMPPLGDNLARLLSDIDVMFGHGRTDFQNLVATTFNGDRAALAQLILDSDAALANRAQASAGTAVHSGANDALKALFDSYQTTSGVPNLMKRWVVTASDPCGMCAALNGQMVGINAEFDYNATLVEKDYRRVWRNLTGPPRHPNCRCQLELVKT